MPCAHVRYAPVRGALSPSPWFLMVCYLTPAYVPFQFYSHTYNHTSSVAYSTFFAAPFGDAARGERPFWHLKTRRFFGL